MKTFDSTAVTNDTKLAAALLAHGVDIPEPFIIPSAEPKIPPRMVFAFNPAQPVADTDEISALITAGEIVERFQNMSFWKSFPHNATVLMRCALDNFQRLNKQSRNGNALVQHVTTHSTPTGPVQDIHYVRQNWGDGDYLTPVKIGRSWYLIRKSDAAAQAEGVL